MSKKILWLLVSALIVLTLVMAACGPAEPKTTPSETTPQTTTPPTTAPPTTTPPITTPPTQEPQQKPPVATEAPKYGGTLTISTTTSPNPKGFWTDISEKYFGSDWTRGPAGSNLYNPQAGLSSLEDAMGSQLVESWEMPQQGVWVLNIRRGMHWQQTGFPAAAITNGREITADDLVWSFNWGLVTSTKSWIHISQPAIAKASSIEKTGPWQVTIKTPLDYLTSYVWLIGAGGGYMYLYPPEVAQKYNHQWVYQGEGWPYQEAVGMGPFMYSEVVAGSYTKRVRNPNYYGNDPVGSGKGNQLPYIDTIKTLYLTDRSTQLAALRTGKIDMLGAFTREEWKREIQLTPRYKWSSAISDTTGNRVIFMRTDKKDKPFSDIRVRQALMMATDFNTIKDQYYAGAAEIDVWPVNSNFKATIYTPLNEMPKEVQDLYTYNPDKAKQLLKEAGYPNGFKVSIVVTNLGNDVDDVSIFKAMWAKAGVELILDIKEQSTFNTIQAQKNFEEMLYRFNYSNWPQDFYFTSRRGGSTNNLSFVNDPPGTDPVIEEAFAKVNAAMMVDNPTVYKVLKDLRPYIMQSAAVIPRPTPYTYAVWQPWLKNYYGSLAEKYHWIDQDLKKSLGF